MIYGEPQFKIEEDETDRIGIRTLILSKLWQGSRSGMTIDELDAEAPEMPIVPSGMEYVARKRRQDGGALQEVWGFHGVHGNGKDVTFKTRGNSREYGFQPGFAQVDIALHPKLQELLDKYEGYPFDGQIFFPPQLSGNSVGLGFTGKQSTAGKTNPMFGQKDFLRMEGTYSYRYATFDPSGIGDREGKIFSTGELPGRPPTYSGRNWLKAPTPWQQRGPVTEVVEVYWLSGDGGWPVPIYGNTGSDGSRSVFLTTGSLQGATGL